MGVKRDLITYLALSCMLIMTISGCGSRSIPPPEVPGGSQLDSGFSGWPMLAGNPQRTSQSGSSGPTNPVLNWEYSHPTYDNDEIVIGNKGIIYGSGFDAIEAYGHSGTLLWRKCFAFRNFYDKYPLANGGLVFETSSQDENLDWHRLLTAIDASGEVLWKHEPPSSGTHYYRPDLSDGLFMRIYIDDAYHLIHLSNTGEVVSDIELPISSHAFIINDDGSVYSSNGKDNLALTSPQGELIFSVGRQEDTNPAESIRKDELGNLYVLRGQNHDTWDQRIYSYTPDGSLRFTIELDNPGDAVRWLEVSHDGVIFIHLPDAQQIITFSTFDGHELWSFPFGDRKNSNLFFDEKSSDYFLLSGFHFISSENNPECIRLDSAGEIVWQLEGIVSVIGTTKSGLTIVKLVNGEIAALSIEGHTIWTLPRSLWVDDPVVDGQGNIFFGSGATAVKHSPTGDVAWQHEFELADSEPYIRVKSVSLNHDGNLLVSTSNPNLLWALDHQGKLDWTVDSSNGSYIPRPIPFASDKLVIQNHNLFWANSDGVLQSQFDLGYISSRISLGQGGSFHFSNGDQLVHLNSDGTSIWEIDPSEGSYLTFNSDPPIIASNGTVFYASPAQVIGISSGGTEIQSFSIPDYERMQALALATDGTLYVFATKTEYIDLETSKQANTVFIPPPANYYSDLFAFRPDGSLKWRTEYGLNLGFDRYLELGDLILDRNGRAYFFMDHSLICLNAEGEQVFEFEVVPPHIRFPRTTNLAMSDRGDIIFGYDNRLVSIGDG